MTAWSAGELAISIKETKIAKGVSTSNEFLATRYNQCIPEIGGPLGMELKWCSAHRMAECQSRRVQGLPRSGPLQLLGQASGGSRDSAAPPPPVHRIPDHRVPNVLQVNPDLVGSAGVELEPEQVGNLEAGHDEGVGPGRPAGGDDRHPLAVVRVTGDGGLDPDRAGIQVSPGQRRVGPLHPPRRDGGPELPVGLVGLGHDHEARGVPVQPMHDARPPFGTTGQGGSAGHQRIDQGVVPVTRRGMHHQAGGLVDDREVLVLVDER